MGLCNWVIRITRCINAQEYPSFVWNIQKLNRESAVVVIVCFEVLSVFPDFFQLKFHCMNNLSCPIVLNTIWFFLQRKWMPPGVLRRKLLWVWTNATHRKRQISSDPLVTLFIGRNITRQIKSGLSRRTRHMRCHCFSFISCGSLVYLMQNVWNNIKALHLVSKSACWLILDQCDVSGISSIWSEMDGKTYIPACKCLMDVHIKPVQPATVSMY